jgi:hypothetical protein
VAFSFSSSQLCCFCHILDQLGAARIERCAIPGRAKANVARVIVGAASRRRTTQL